VLGVGRRQFVVSDPDGYLVRFAQTEDRGRRPGVHECCTVEANSTRFLNPGESAEAPAAVEPATAPAVDSGVGRLPILG
jgi:hypothetical protein